MENLKTHDGRFIEDLNHKDFRVVVFGSARIKPGDEIYEQVVKLGKGIGGMGADVVTGGGPGLMEAANKGHMLGKHKGDDAQSIGVGIELPFEESMNKHLDISEEHKHFSTRLDMFMALSNAVVVAPGGVGTLLELAYTWQLVQVGHICKIPIIVIGESWKELKEWAKKHLVGNKLADAEDIEYLQVVDTVEEALKILETTKGMFDEGCYDACLNWDKYKDAIQDL
jgi:hypothetical protein